MYVALQRFMLFACCLKEAEEEGMQRRFISFDLLVYAAESHCMTIDIPACLKRFFVLLLEHQFSSH